MQKLTVALEGKTPDGTGIINVVPFVTSDGIPKVVLMIRTDGPSTYEAKLDGNPAIALFLGEGEEGTENAPWELGHLLAEKWEDTKRLATKKT